MGPVGNTWPIELIGNTLGFTGPAGSAVAVDAESTLTPPCIVHSLFSI